MSYGPPTPRTTKRRHRWKPVPGRSGSVQSYCEDCGIVRGIWPGTWWSRLDDRIRTTPIPRCGDDGGAL